MVLGVDVGGTKVAVAAVDGVTVSEATEDPTVTDMTEALLDGIDGAVKRMIERVGQPEAIGVGVLADRVRDRDGRDQRQHPAHRQAAARGARPPVRSAGVRRQRRATALLAEAHILGEKHLVMLTLGTGVGGGVVIDGMTFRARTGWAPSWAT